jgi:hypothetical protein
MTLISIFLLIIFVLIPVIQPFRRGMPAQCLKLKDYICFDAESKEKGGTGTLPAPPLDRF